MNNNTITITEEQLEAFNRGEPITLQRKFSYPAYFKNIAFGFVVKFTDLTTGEVVEGDAEEDWDTGYISTKWIEHTSTSRWEYLPNYKEVTRWEPQRGEWYVTQYGSILKDCSMANTQLFGIERQTKEEAEYAARQMRIHNRLLAYVAEFDKGWKADWDNSDDKFYVFLNRRLEKYMYSFDCTGQDIGKVYMSEKCATELCHKLNSGEVII